MSMLAKLQAIYRRALHKWQHNEAKDRGPVPPVRVPHRSSPKVAPQTKPATQPPVVKEIAQPAIVSRGNNKNVLVTVRPNQSADEALRLADQGDTQELPGLETIEDGLDPYNSGVFSTQRVWRESR